MRERAWPAISILICQQGQEEGFEQIAAIFEETAGNEKEHAKLWFKELGGIGDTAAT